MLKRPLFKFQLASFVKYALLFVIVIRLSGGSHFITLLAKEFYKEQFIEKCRNGHISNQLKKVIFSKEEYKRLEWKNEKEILLNGVVNDVVKMEILADKSVAVVYFSDEIETKVLNILDDSSDDEEDKTVKKSLPDEYFKTLALNTLNSFFITISILFYFSVRHPIDVFSSFLLPPELLA